MNDVVIGGSVVISTGARVDWEFICQMFLKKYMVVLHPSKQLLGIARRFESQWALVVSTCMI